MSVTMNISNAFESVEDVIREWRAGRKIDAIKVYRRIYGVGLKEAKDACEAIGKALESAPLPKTEPKLKIGDKVVALGDPGDVGAIIGVKDDRYSVRWGSSSFYDAAYCDWRESDLVKTGTFIVAVFENGKYRPNSNPFVHTDESAAIAEAERLSKQHVGQKFGTFALIADSETPPSDTKTVRV